jgi:hypothetical protein
MAAQAVQDVVAVEHLAGLGGQQRQQFELGAGQLDLLAQAQHLACFKVDRQALEDSARAGRRHGALAPQYGLHARHQLARLKGLGQVVVGAQFQADHAVHHVAARGQHDDRDVAFLANLAAQREAVHLGQHDVQDGRVVGAGAQFGQPLAGAQGAVQHEVKTREVGGQRRGQVLVVVDQEDAGHAAIIGSRVRSAFTTGPAAPAGPGGCVQSPRRI